LVYNCIFNRNPFWIDANKDGFYQEGIEEPIPYALVELFDENGTKIRRNYNK